MDEILNLIESVSEGFPSYSYLLGDRDSFIALLSVCGLAETVPYLYCRKMACQNELVPYFCCRYVDEQMYCQYLARERETEILYLYCQYKICQSQSPTSTVSI